MFYSDENSPCTSTGNHKYYRVTVGENGVTKESSNKMFIAALTAAAAKKELRVTFDDSVPQCCINKLWLAF
ncbi:MAG: hypothetical protein RPR97_01960 [Colwellia sp.]